VIPCGLTTFLIFLFDLDTIVILLLTKFHVEIDHVAFLDNLVTKVEDMGIYLNGAKLDHIAYQTGTKEEYDKLKPEFERIAKLMKEPLVGGRRIGVFKFTKPLKYKDQSIDAIELIEPKDGQRVSSGLEHAEYLLPMSLEKFIDKYPDIDWNTRALNRDKFPMLILDLTDSMRVKFPRFSILNDLE